MGKRIMTVWVSFSFILTPVWGYLFNFAYFTASTVYTAYEYLEKRFDLKQDPLPLFFSYFNVVWLTIYAPAIILSVF
jgi:hypothetical protein